ncbi:hypothetical protein GCM10018793_43250 [Streptomyces sulfonofaciens]|uniref:alcohol dehydrogenase n=1 Tax=Streptomyces sulfonofaciens TaxID=68272 RepID=A0A919GEN2_9ACTN|nr:zinc-binding dehydrogenase [Streptomyces sulfonofaciens]GHH82788.1 hypothetical protein GCM10018793_43250 [Streptomyces sulfonofaciens]
MSCGRGRLGTVRRGRARFPEELGAELHIDSTDEDPAAVLQELGRAAAVIATAADSASMSPLVPGPAPHGRLIVLGGGGEPLTVDGADLLFPTRTVVGGMVGSAIENEDDLAFVQRRGIRAYTEAMSLSEAPRAFTRMMAGAARFRIVLDMAA